jgi:hypothetical protein
MRPLGDTREPGDTDQCGAGAVVPRPPPATPPPRLGASVGAALWAAAAGPWLSHHRIRPHIPDDEREWIWMERVAGHGCALPGSVLRAIAPAKTGWSAEIVMPRGEADHRVRVERRAPASPPRTNSPRRPSLSGRHRRAAHLARLSLLEYNPRASPILHRPGAGPLDGSVPDREVPRRLSRLRAALDARVPCLPRPHCRHHGLREIRTGEPQ